MGLLILFGVALIVISVVGTGMVVHGLRRPNRRTYAWALANGQPTDPSHIGRRFTEEQITFPDGQTTYLWLIDGDDASGPLVIMNHGWANSRYGAIPTVPLVTPYVSRIALFDVRAHGDSSAKQCWLGVREVPDLAHVINHLHDTGLDGNGLVLYGASMGAGFCIDVTSRATDDPNLLRSQVRGVIADGAYRFPMQPVGQYLRMHHVPPQPFAFLAGVYLWVRLKWLSGDLRPFDRVKLVAKVRCPVLVVHGSHDRICPIRTARQIAEAAPRGRYAEFHGGDHDRKHHTHVEHYHEVFGEFFAQFQNAVPMQSPPPPTVNPPNPATTVPT